jgi:hypothetical protein
MKLEEILNEWNTDSKIDKIEISNESLTISQLHNKYLRIMTAESVQLRTITHEYNKMYKLKWEYYLGILDSETLHERNWIPVGLKILRQDIDIYLNSDEDLSRLKMKQELQKEKLTALDSIMKSITNRGFQIKNYIDYERFKVGA